MFSELKELIKKKLFFRLEALEEEMDAMRSRFEISDEDFEKFQNDRISKDYLDVYDHVEPLVSVCIGTYNRGKLLTERCLPSILRQTYRNLEVIVVGDCCTDETEALIKKIDDKRLFFLNLSERGKYPDNPRYRWMVAGTATFNKALSISKGDFITHLDDDDEYVVDRVEKLVQFILEKRCDVAWHPFWAERENGKWLLNKAESFKKAKVTTSSVFYHRWFSKLPWDLNAYKFLEPGDWNRFRKIKYLGAEIARYPEPLLKHYKERTQAKK